MTAKKNGAHPSADTIGSASAFLASPGAAGFLMSQKMALEAARFWARRMRAYADQLDALAGCSDPMQLVKAQTRFVQRMQEDYAEEGRAVAEMVVPRAGPGEDARSEIQH